MMKEFCNFNKLLLLLCLLPGFTAFGQSPTKKQYIVKAEEAYADKNFYLLQ